jgi:HAD superfamily hydrolase (TIGR01490 family)
MRLSRARNDMYLAVFDLDNTLLSGDSDFLWGQFLVEHQLVDGDWYARENRRYHETYKAGQLDIRAYQRFAQQPLRDHGAEKLEGLRPLFIREKIAPIISPATRELLACHRDRGDELMIITATNRFVTAPIAAELGVSNLLATEPEIVDGLYTGEIAGIPCYREGKVERLEQWLKKQGRDFDSTWFYSDSHNDLPLLRAADFPVAVDPDDELRRVAEGRKWPIVSLLGTESGAEVFAKATAGN